VGAFNYYGGKMDNIHSKLEQVRKPRVHIKYEVETGDGMVQKELPFVVGVMGDFSGDQNENKLPLRERNFTQIDQDNFNQAIRNLQPRLKFRVENKLLDDGGQMQVDLQFKSLDDFAPENIVLQVPSLKKLLDARNKLRDLLTKVDCSEKLEDILENVLGDTKNLKRLACELQTDDAGGEDE